MPDKRAAWFSSPVIWFLASAGAMIPVAVIARIDDWFHMGNEFSQMLLILVVAYGLMGLLYFLVDRGKTKGLLIGWLGHLHLWMWVASFFLMLYYGHIYNFVLSSPRVQYPLMRARQNVVSGFTYALVVVGGLAFVANIIQARIKAHRSSH